MDEKRKTYPSDLSDKEWARLETLIPSVKSGGRPAKYRRRELVNAMLYVLRTGAVGACCRTIYRLGKVCMATSDAGVNRGFGSKSTTNYGTNGERK
jgi:hypothetical protein